MCIGWGTPTLVDSYPSTPKQRAPKQQTLQLGGQRPRRSEIRRPLHRRAKPSLPPLLARRGVLEAVSPQQFVAHTSFCSCSVMANCPELSGLWLQLAFALVTPELRL
jgi:hypothetical protein